MHIISCFRGATHKIEAPEMTDIDANTSMGDVRDFLSSKCVKGPELFIPQITDNLNRTE